MMKNTSILWLLSVAAVVSASGCIAATDVEPESEVGVVEQGLGGYTEVVNIGGGLVMDIGPTFTVVRRGISGCNSIDVFYTTTGEKVPAPPLPGAGCRDVTAATSQPSVLVADKSVGKIYLLVTGFVTNWVLVASNAPNVAQVVSNDTHLFWHGADFSYHKVGIGTGVESLQAISGTTQILGIEGTNLYIMLTVSSTSYQLLQLSWPNSGSSSISVLASSSNSFAPDFTFDVNHFYWLTNASAAGGSNLLRRVSKSGGAVADYRSSTSVRYYVPQSNGASLWWVDESVSTGAGFIRRKNLANANVTSADFPLMRPHKMRQLPDGLYWLSEHASGRVRHG